MNSFKESIKKFFRPTLIGDFLEQRSISQWYKSKRQSMPSVEQAIDSIQKRWPIILEEDTDKPVFLFSSSWRSGSTLLQRIVNSDPEILLWGEPFADCNLVQNLADSLRIFQAKEPPEYYFLKSLKVKSSLSHRWTANLYPNINYLFRSHRAFFQTLYAESANQYGFSRWGFKEVRLTIDHAIYLKWLFPHAKFLFLYRNPYKAYESCYTWRNLYWNWPNQPVIGPEKFGTYWLNQVTGFLEDYQKVDGFLIKYEDLCSEKISIGSIGTYLDAELNENILDTKIGSSKDKKDQKETPKYLLKRLERVVSPLAETLGYHR
jgi:hypothetical protein